MILGISLLITSVVVAVLQTVMSVQLLRVMRRPAPPRLADAECPPVLAVLCLRGTDPFLLHSLERLFQLDYPEYTVRVVIDTPDDPVRSLVEDAVRRTMSSHVEVIDLGRRDRFCSAKMSSLLRATEELPKECEIVATFDGDAILHAGCLRELVTPLVHGEAQVTTGNRWFAPARPTMGALARLQWNLGCVPLMQSLGLPWGGCLAMRAELIQDPELRSLYAHAFAEDMLLGSFLSERGEKVEFVPQATIVNREDLSVRGLFNFLTRQMLCVRLHHRKWVWIVGYGSLLSALLGVICPIGLLVSGLRWWCLASLGIMSAALLVTTALQGRAVRQLIAVRKERLIEFTPLVVFAMLASFPVTQIVTLLANLRAVGARRITWRGLTYELGNDPIVRLTHEVPVTDFNPVTDLNNEPGDISVQEQELLDAEMAGSTSFTSESPDTVIS